MRALRYSLLFALMVVLSLLPMLLSLWLDASAPAFMAGILAVLDARILMVCLLLCGVLAAFCSDHYGHIVLYSFASSLLLANSLLWRLKEGAGMVGMIGLSCLLWTVIAFYVPKRAYFLHQLLAWLLLAAGTRTLEVQAAETVASPVFLWAMVLVGWLVVLTGCATGMTLSGVRDEPRSIRG